MLIYNTVYCTCHKYARKRKTSERQGDHKSWNTKKKKSEFVLWAITTMTHYTVFLNKLQK